MTEDIRDIVAVTDVLHHRALDQYHERTAEVQLIQDKLDELDRMRETMQADTGSLDARRLAGADTMWQGWMAQRRTQLQQEMAIARARQMESLGRAQTSFARLDAAKGIERQQAADRRQEALKKDADNQDWLSTLSRWSD